MDPISAVGLAAGTAQFLDIGCKAIIGTLKLLRDIKDTPSWLRDLSNDIEKSFKHIQILQETIERSSFEDLVQPNHVQIQTADEAIRSAYDAMMDLKKALEPFSRDQVLLRHGRWRRAWTSVSSVTERSSIEQKMQKVMLLNHEVSRALQIIQLGMQKAMNVQFQQANALAKADRRALESQIGSLETTNQAIHSETGDTRLKLAELQGNVQSSQANVVEIDRKVMDVARVVESAHDTTQRLKRDFETGCSTLRVNQTHLRDSIDTTRMESQQIRADIQRLRDDLMPWVMGRTMTRSSPLEPLTPLLSKAESSELQVELERTLVEFPSDFKEACEDTIHALNFTDGRTQRRTPWVQHRCNCSKAFKRTIARSGRLSFLFESWTEHDHMYDCQFRSKRLWRYMLAFQLLPLFQKTFAFTMTQTSGAGGCSLGVYLNCYRTVKRGSSELFQLFDSFPGKLKRKRCETVSQDTQEGQICFGNSDDWEFYKIEASQGDIDELAQSFTELLHQGYGWDKDEYGNTVLHELASLVVYCRSTSGPDYAQLKHLIEMCLAAGIDIYAPSEPGSYRTYVAVNLWLVGAEDAITVPQILANCAVVFPKVFERIPFYDTIGSHSFNESGRIYKDMDGLGWMSAVWCVFTAPANRWVVRHQSVLCVLRNHPDLTPLFGYGPFENSILSHSLDRVEQNIENFGSLSYDCPRSGLYPLDFALGWPEGLQRLVRAGYKPEGTLELSISVGDVESTTVLLRANGFALARHPMVIYIASCSNMSVMHGVIVDALKKSRTKLRNLALEHFPVDDKNYTGLLEEEVLDTKAIEVCNKLLGMRIPIPAELHPGHLPTIYSAIRYDSQVDYLDTLFDCGFQNIDGVESMRKPIQSLVMDRAWTMSNAFDVVKWFIDKQANLEFITEGSFPNILFYFAIVYSERIRRSPSIYSKSKLDGLVSKAATSCKPLCTDSCSCYCSSLGGCLPLHKVWVCNPQWTAHEGCEFITMTALTSTLDHWISLCRMDEAQSILYYQAMCQLEIFERLGMAHTCCTYTTTRSIKRESMEDDEKGRLQDEDSDLKRQLTAIMSAFENLRKEYPGDLREFWMHWWQRIDEILPELTPMERCRCKGLNRQEKNFHSLFRERIRALSESRADIERETGESNGFQDSEFDDVIDMHLVQRLGL
ncbi:hypothetical protein DE146DRAFT_663677 [Phaeosphaeria sp. MPI-PUGE-AT-0046c]|nr:hypothetical protein DE146DRAFT_663677 [Phaeosphaeria sp. MPI-PUGE-AT-0046c]